MKNQHFHKRNTLTELVKMEYKLRVIILVRINNVRE